MTVVLTSAAGSSAFTLSDVSLDDVSSIDVVVDTVEARRSEPGDAEGAWFSLGVDPAAGVPIDLKNIGSATITLAVGTVPTGIYEDARLFFDPDQATITLENAICLGMVGSPGEMCLDAGSTHDLFIPSGDETGIKTGAQFEVNTGDNTVVLGFDANASVQTLAWAPGLDAIVMSPVITEAQ